jgi:hypothetical protein
MLSVPRMLSFGGYGVIKIPNFQKLLHHICENGFEHHIVAGKEVL